MELTDKTLKSLVFSESLDKVSLSSIVDMVRSDPGIQANLPDGDYQVDPRSGLKVIFNSARSKRPHDSKKDSLLTPEVKECIICSGKTTSIIDLARLSTGYTFINQNLFPILYPFEIIPDLNLKCQGLHFLQWTSSVHHKDWHNLPREDCTVVMHRLCALEEKLLKEAPDFCTSNREWGETEGTKGYVSIIKNYGRLVGGSLQHAHQQIMLSSVMPLRYSQNLSFENTYSCRYTDFMLSKNGAELMVKDYGKAVLLVPYFMRRPYDMQLVLKNTSRRYLHQLDEEEITQCGEGISDAAKLIHSVMPGLGRETAYNMVIHNGPGAGLYIEFLPYTQETGGYEHVGLYLCQGRPASIAGELRARLSGGLFP